MKGGGLKKNLRKNIKAGKDKTKWNSQIKGQRQKSGNGKLRQPVIKMDLQGIKPSYLIRGSHELLPQETNLYLKGCNTRLVTKTQ